MVKLKLEGRSGCKIEIVENGADAFVRKFSKTVAYNPRLLDQARKQDEFHGSGNETFATAKVLEMRAGSPDALAYFDMEYIHGEKFSEYLERISVREIKAFIERLTTFLNSRPTTPDEKNYHHAIQAKVGELQKLLSSKEGIDLQVTDQAFHYLSNVPKVSLPVGLCHGDLTFSNMVFVDHKIYIIDFLDSFVDSPIIDLVKLRQDSFFFWSIFIDKDLPEYRKNKLLQIFQFIDTHLDSYVSAKGWRNWYDYLQVMNLMRILPYVNTENEISFVQKAIAKQITLCS